MTRKTKFLILGLFTCLAISSIFLINPIAQNLAYHSFADQKTIFSIPNFANVISNFAFFLIGLYGMLIVNHRTDILTIRIIYGIMFFGILCTGIGSAYYHYVPNNSSLVYDRIPMTIVFMAFTSAIICERISPKVAMRLLFPLLIIGVVSVLYWRYTELHNAGDLRFYGLVQFYPMILIPVIILLFPSKNNKQDFGILAWIFFWYLVAKTFEYYDKPVFLLTGFISGHSLKHLAAAIATLYMIKMFTNKYVLQPAQIPAHKSLAN